MAQDWTEFKSWMATCALTMPLQITLTNGGSIFLYHPLHFRYTARTEDETARLVYICMKPVALLLLGEHLLCEEAGSRQCRAGIAKSLLIQYVAAKHHCTSFFSSIRTLVLQFFVRVLFAPQASLLAPVDLSSQSNTRLKKNQLTATLL